MAEISQITDHEDQAQARLPEQFKGKVLTIAMVRALAAETQDIEDSAFPMFSLLDIATMIGAQLDGIGDILTERRDGKSDADYRVALIAKGARITASGTPEQVIERFLALTGSTVAVYYGEAFPAGYSIYGDRSACVHPTLWTPANIATDGWFDAADAATITESGGAVSQWDDKSGNGEDLVQPTGANQPTTDLRTLNGLNVLDCDGGDFMAKTGFPVDASGDHAIIGVALADVIDNAADSLWSLDNANDYQFAAFHASQFDGRITTSVGVNVVLAGGPYAGAHIFGTIFDYAGDGKVTARADGAVDGTPQDYNATKLDASQTLRVFANRTGVQLPDGAMAEFVVVTDVSLANIQKIEGYLAWKWGLEGSLPGGHPYKLAAPMVLLACDLLPIMEAASPAGVYVGLMDFGIWEDDDPMLWEDSDTVYLTYDSSGR